MTGRHIYQQGRKVRGEHEGISTGNVELRNVRKRFGNTIAVDDISLEIEDGELIAFLGPSGCGKTTTLRMISGFEYPTEGEIIPGQDVTGMDPRHHDIAMVFQELALYPHKTVRTWDSRSRPGFRVRVPDSASTRSWRRS